MNSAALRIRPGAPLPATGVAPADPAPMSGPVKAARGLIWVYLILWITEGMLRKWFLVGLSDVLLIIRDPVVVAIYAAALVGKVFPFNAFVVVIAALGGLSTLAGMAVLPEMPAVVLFGFRANFLHLPLLFVMGRVLTIKDLRWMALLFILGSLPQVVLMAKQYRSSPESWWNLGAGGGKQIEAARGVVRPSGTFSYISGPVLYFSGAMAMLLGSLLLSKWTRWWMLLPALGAVLLAGAVGGSRSLLMNYAGIGAIFVFGCVLYPKAFKSVLKFLAIGAVAMVALGSLSLFREGRETTTQRATSATRNEGGMIEVVADRLVGPIWNSIKSALDTDILGNGLGLGTNGGAALANRRGKFVLAEDEWSRVLLESGPVLGLSYMATRLILVVWMFVLSCKAARQGNLLPLTLWAAGWMFLMMGQFGQPTTLGGAVLLGGLVLTALKIPVSETIFASPDAVSADPAKPLEIGSSIPENAPASHTPFNVTREQAIRNPPTSPRKPLPRPLAQPSLKGPAAGPKNGPAVPSTVPASTKVGPVEPSYKPGKFTVHSDGKKASPK